MKPYKCHKIVQAVKCSEIYAGNLSDRFEAKYFFLLKADDGEFYKVPHDIFARGQPKGDFYIVEYADGYRTWSPADAFESGYTEIIEHAEKNS